MSKATAKTAFNPRATFRSIKAATADVEANYKGVNPVGIVELGKAKYGIACPMTLRKYGLKPVSWVGGARKAATKHDAF